MSMMYQHILPFAVPGSSSPVQFVIEHAYCVGFSGRDTAKTLHHIEELVAIGVPRPEEIPLLFPIAVSLVSQPAGIQVVGCETSGEIELVLLYGTSLEDSYLTVGSDHTDRGLETVDIGKSKQICGKPVASVAWPIAAVRDKWDRMHMVSEVHIDGEWKCYQDDHASAMLPLKTLLAFLERKGALKQQSVYFLGTVPLVQGFVYGDAFRTHLSSEVFSEELMLEYAISDVRKE